MLTNHFNLIVKMFIQVHYSTNTSPFGDASKIGDIGNKNM